MREIIIREELKKNYVIGELTKKACTSPRFTNKVLYQFRIYNSSKRFDYADDIFFFEKRCGQLYLIPDMGFINLDGPPGLMDVYQFMPYKKDFTFKQFVDYLLYTYLMIED